MILLALENVLVCTQKGHHIACKPTVTAFISGVAILAALMVLVIASGEKSRKP